MGFLASLARVFRPTPSPERQAALLALEVAQARQERACTLLQEATDLAEAGDPRGAVKRYAALKRLGDEDLLREGCAMAACAIIKAYADAGNPAAARAIYNGMAALGDAVEILAARVLAAGSLFAAYARVRDIASIRVLHESLDACANADTIGIRAATANYLISSHLEAGDMDAARDVYSLPALAEPANRLARARAAHALVVAGDTPTTHCLDMKTMAKGAFGELRVYTTFLLADVYRRQEACAVADRVCESPAACRDTEESLRKRFAALHGLVHAHAGADDAALAAQLYASMEEYADLALAVERRPYPSGLSGFSGDERREASQALSRYCMNAGHVEKPTEAQA